jgi:hypothetical protein
VARRVTGCNVKLIATGRIGRAVPAVPFAADCACGHQVTGDACAACRMCATPGCLTCWNSPESHVCPVEFATEAVTR